MIAMIFAAGLGTRLKPLTDTLPKALVPLAGKTLLEWQIEQIRNAGIDDILINIHHFPDQIIHFLQAHNHFGCNIRLSDERECLLETGGGLQKATQGVTGPVLACNVDILSNIRLHDLLKTYRQTGKSQLVVSHRDTQRYLCFDRKNMLCGWVNKTTGELRGERGTELAFSGMQVLSPDTLQRLQERERGRFSLVDFYLSIRNDTPLCAYIPNDYRMMDVGKISQIEEAEQFAQSL